MPVAQTDRWLDAQVGVLGSVLISPELTPRLIAETAETDYRGQYRLVYQAIRAVFLDGKPVDPITVRDKLGPESASFLMQLMEVTPTAANFDAYVAACRAQAKVSRLQELGAKIVAAGSLDCMERLVASASELLIDSGRLEVWDSTKLALDFVERHSGPAPDFLEWPIPDIGRACDVERSDLVYIAGIPSSGKTAFTLQCANYWSAKLRVGYFSLETKQSKLADRQMSAATQIPLRTIKRNLLSPEQWQTVTAAGSAMSKKHLYVIRSREQVSVADIRACAMAYRLDVVIIDYVQLLAGEGRSDYERVTNISMELHRFAQSSNCYVIGLSQLKRTEDGHEPGKSDLRSSGQLEQDADIIMFLHQPRKENAQRILKCDKNKEGQLFKLVMDFDGAAQCFTKSRISFAEMQRAMRAAARDKKAEQRYEESRLMPKLPASTPVPEEFETEGDLLNENNRSHER